VEALSPPFQESVTIMDHEQPFDDEPTAPWTRRRLLAASAWGLAAAGGLLPVLDSPALAQEGAARDYLREAKPQRDARMEWWRDARFGMFIHWGVYSVPAGFFQGKPVPGIGEWIEASGAIPPEEYAKFPPRFNPVKYDAKQWVRIMKDAGVKYVVITSKHHDGFAMFDSKLTDWDIVDATPYKRDVLRDLSRECKKAGIKFCTYHSILDWHHPAQQPNPQAKDFHASLANNMMKPGRKQEYLTYLKGQLKEILDNYDPEVLWFDGEWVSWWTEDDAKDLYNYLRSLKPSLIINNRIGKGRKGMEGLNKGEGYAGDFGTPEQQIPPSGLPGVDWESCMTMNDTWGYKSNDHNWKSSTTLIRNLCDIASKGGNFLLNIGPTSEGEIPPASVERLADIGKWTRVNGDAIYGTHASPYREKLPWGRVTSRKGKLYLHVFDWPADRKLGIPALENRVKRAYLLADKKHRLPVEQYGAGIVVDLPATAPDPIATVIVVELNGEPKAV
jgi:alpha-L-fucosidase